MTDLPQTESTPRKPTSRERALRWIRFYLDWLEEDPSLPVTISISCHAHGMHQEITMPIPTERQVDGAADRRGGSAEKGNASGHDSS